jgi:hypothetical protein
LRLPEDLGTTGWATLWQVSAYMAISREGSLAHEECEALA